MRTPAVQRLLNAISATALLVSLASCGGDGDTGTDASGDREVRTVEVAMVDIAFEPVRLEVNRGETVRFRFTNRGKVAHDAFIGDRDAQADHEAEMADMKDNDAHGGHGDDDDDAVTVEPGDTGELTYTFDEPATLEMGCHQPGHYDAGMKMTIAVT